MVKEVVSLEDIKEWLVTGKEDPDTFVDLPWTVIQELKDGDRIVGYRLSHPKVPFNLLVLDLQTDEKAPKAIRIVVETGIRTIDMDKDFKLRIYRALLELNKQAYIKIYLFGNEDEVGVAADFDKKYLTKEEFEHNLAYVLATVMLLAQEKKLSNYIAAETFEVLQSLVKAWYKAGVPKEEARKRLKTAGLDESLIDVFISSIYQDKKEKGFLDTLFT